ncbi:hypothetical protein KC221_26055, partial [Mycobacterium tuberculosis]|nr:hypothetical protein [Mycobacterium tuberculosis]
DRFSALHTKVALYAVIRIWATAFDLDPAWGRVLLVVALVTALWGAVASASASREARVHCVAGGSHRAARSAPVPIRLRFQRAAGLR